jgi:hypothetical protein
MEFGYYPKTFDKNIGPISIYTLPDLSKKVAAVLASNGVEKDWIYPSNRRIFGMPKTHAIEHSETQDAERLKFLIWCFGFFVGMRMTETEAGFLDATPIKPHALVDFYPHNDAVERALAYADKFWNDNSNEPRIAKAMTGIIHTYFFSRSPKMLDFEHFIYRYIALDGCYFVYARIRGVNPRGGNHSQRVVEMCNAFGIPLPKWAKIAANAQSSLSVARNETIHEGLFFDEPLGFRVFGGNDPTKNDHGLTLLSMSHLISRLITALLGMSHSKYVTSSCETREMCGFDL